MVSINPNPTSKRRPATATVGVALALTLLISLVGGSASAAADPVARAKEALSAATKRRVATEQRVAEIRTTIQDLAGELATMDTTDADLTRQLAEAKDAMRRFAIAAYIDGRKADVATAALDPTKAQALVWQSTLSVGQAASADEVARRVAELKAAVGPQRMQLAQDLDAARQALADASNDAIQAAALERDAEAQLAAEREAARQRAAEARARAQEAAAAQAAARSAAPAAPARSPKPAAAAANPAPTAFGPAAGNPTAAEAALLAKIRRCESGGNYSIVSASGRYRGAYQFDYRTWAGVGGSGDPAAASPAEQDYRALLLLRARGSRPWPVCGR